MPNGVIGSTSSDTTAKVWDTRTWELISSYTGHTDIVFTLEYIRPDVIATGANDGMIHIWYISTGEGIRTITNVNSAPVQSLQLLPNGQLASGDQDYIIHIWDINTGTLIRTMHGNTNYVDDLALMSDYILAASSGDGLVYVYDLHNYTVKFKFTDQINGAPIAGILRITADTLATSSSTDGSIFIWNITEGGPPLQKLFNHTDGIYYALDLFNANTMISASQDSTIRFWEVSSGKLLKTADAGSPIVSMIRLGKW